MIQTYFFARFSVFDATSAWWSTSHVCLTALCLGVSSTLVLAALMPNWLLVSCVFMAGSLAIRYNVARPLLFFLLGLAWANLQFSLHANAPFPDEFERVDMRIIGTVVDLPSQNRGDWRFRLRVDAVADYALNSIVGERIQLSCYRCPLSFSAGQQWAFTVRVKRPHGYASAGAFDYEKYLFRHSIIAQGYIRTKDPTQLNGVKGNYVNRWRERIKTELNSLNVGVGRNMIAALTIGDKSGFSQAQKKVFQETGVSHLMAISGLHIGLVFLCAGWLFKWLLWPFARYFERWPRQHMVLLPAMTAAILYAGLAGFSVSTQRALIMLSVFVICRFWVRGVSLLKVLIISVTLLLIYDPFSVLDVGFWLSAGAVFVIALCAGENDSLLRLQPRLWLGMLPMTSLFFGQVSLVSPLVNLLMVPLFCLLLIPITLVSLVLTNLGLAELGMFICSALIVVYDYIFFCLQWSSSWSLARWYTTPFAVWQWGLVGLLIVLEVGRYRWRALVWLVLVGSLFVNNSDAIDDDELKIALLDVGQGLAMVIRTATSVTIYDTGPRYSSGFSAADAVLIPYLRYHGISDVDRLVISHADNDHIGGLSAVLESMRIEQVLTSRVDKIPHAQACATGQRWVYDQTLFAIISPETNTPDGSNNRSCVIMIEHAGTRVLISGDIEKQVERYLLQKHGVESRALRADILLVPHQGSKTSSTAGFLKAVNPSLGLVAAGYRNHYGHPHKEVMRRYDDNAIEVLSTVGSGTIELTINPAGWRTSRFRQAEQRFWHYQKVSNQP